MAELPERIDQPIRRPYWLLLVGVVLLVGVAVSVYRSTSDIPAQQQTWTDIEKNAGLSANDAVRKALEQQGLDPSSALSYRHYLYFANEADARSAAGELEETFDTTVQAPGEGIDEWAVLADQTVALGAPALEELTRRLDAIAVRFRGEYDGWEVATQI